jgi:hypothetical protein
MFCVSERLLPLWNQHGRFHSGVARADVSTMSVLDQLGGILNQYSSGNPPQDQATEHLQQVATQVPRPQLGGLLANIFHSHETGSFGDNVSQMYSQSNPEQQAGILAKLLQAAGGAGALSSLGLHLPGVGGSSVTPQQAQQVNPEQVKQIANHAQVQNPGIVQEAADFYSQHPQLVQALGTGVAIWALQHFRR